MNNLPEPQMFSSLYPSLKLNVTEPLSVSMITVPILVISMVEFSKGGRRVKITIYNQEIELILVCTFLTTFLMGLVA